MKKIFALFSLFFVLNYSYAQSATFGVTAGATLASYKATVEDISITSDSHTGFMAGFVASLPMSKKISFRPQLNYVQKGGKLSSDGVTDKTILNYLEVPLNFVFNAPTKSGLFFVGAGPSLSFGLSGKDKSSDGDVDIHFGSSANDDLKGFEAAINILAGYQFSGGFFVQANYNAGISNIAPSDPGFNEKYHNRYFGLGVGIMFGNKPKAK